MVSSSINFPDNHLTIKKIIFFLPPPQVGLVYLLVSIVDGRLHGGREAPAQYLRALQIPRRTDLLLYQSLHILAEHLLRHQPAVGLHLPLDVELWFSQLESS